ncbi:uncharacterized protein LOC135349363 isoform X1 [Halichondria panicea]|uniref:uncharacterized protein LOC135349363 isoform X1 n=1 Tax=Halichondria panicea TaxID=6063 RepID=UPI00312B4F36
MFDSCKGSCHIFFLLTLASSRARCYIYSLMDVKNVSATGLSSWLEEKGVQDSYCEVFEDNEIDGEAFLELTENDIKELVKPLGVVKKLVRLQIGVQLPVSTDLIVSSAVDSSSRVNDSTPQRTQSSVPRRSQSSTPKVSGISTNNFAIPQKWKPTIMAAIKEKSLNPEVRNEIVRDLVTHVYAYLEQPTMVFIGEVAKQLVEKHPFMADSGAAPFGSWRKKMMDRVYNVEKGRKRIASPSDETPPTKRGRPKKVSILASRYPAVSPMDEGNTDSEKALANEMENEHPIEETLCYLL